MVCAGHEGSKGQARLHWCEVARPQVHGHDFSCLAFVPFKSTTATAVSAPADGNNSCSNGSCKGDGSGRAAGGGTAPSLVYVSGSEEKVLRVFEATQVIGIAVDSKGEGMELVCIFGMSILAV